MCSIIVKVLVRGKVKRICIKDALYVSIASKFTLDEQVYLEWVENLMKPK
jgi:hypothetical protein